jgi:hypothetical protein
VLYALEAASGRENGVFEAGIDPRSVVSKASNHRLLFPLELCTLAAATPTFTP